MNAPQCYVIRTLPILYAIEKDKSKSYQLRIDNIKPYVSHVMGSALLNFGRIIKICSCLTEHTVSFCKRNSRKAAQRENVCCKIYTEGIKKLCGRSLDVFSIIIIIIIIIINNNYYY